MADTKASEAGRDLVSFRWRNQVAEKAAEVVISRAAELSPSTRAEVLAAVADKPDTEGE